MKPFAIALALTLHATLAGAGPCRPIEYAELKDTSSERLIATYCEYGGLAAKERRRLETLDSLSADFAKMGMLRAARDTDRTIAESEAGIKACLDEQVKIGNALSNRAEPPNPACQARP